jgi:hypothetical protein
MNDNSPDDNLLVALKRKGKWNGLVRIVTVFPCTVTTEHPYFVPEPRVLTERLCQQWLRIRAQNRHLRRASHRPDPAHVEPNMPLTRNNVDHRHHVFATCKDVEGMPYSWTLEATPFMGPSPSPL